MNEEPMTNQVPYQPPPQTPQQMDEDFEKVFPPTAASLFARLAKTEKQLDAIHVFMARIAELEAQGRFLRDEIHNLHLETKALRERVEAMEKPRIETVGTKPAGYWASHIRAQSPLADPTGKSPPTHLVNG